MQSNPYRRGIKTKKAKDCYSAVVRLTGSKLMFLSNVLLVSLQSYLRFVLFSEENEVSGYLRVWLAAEIWPLESLSLPPFCWKSDFSLGMRCFKCMRVCLSACEHHDKRVAKFGKIPFSRLTQSNLAPSLKDSLVDLPRNVREIKKALLGLEELPSGRRRTCEAFAKWCGFYSGISTRAQTHHILASILIFSQGAFQNIQQEAQVQN